MTNKNNISLKLFNTISKRKEDFIPINPDKITIYVCGPTVYDRPHLGNARSIVIYDLWFRLFNKLFKEVCYVRNITDIDDKINKVAKDKNISIGKLTKEVIADFECDMKELKVLPPTIEPKATQNIDKMIEMISKLIANNHAYISENHVLFDVKSYDNYGELSNRSIDDMIAGSRIEIADYKRNPLDFVLWKPSSKKDDISAIFDSPWGKGRPGWHIECSAMSSKYLGVNFDIHGGGADLQFPHHENEIAQSKCAHKGSNYAKYWVHNGFLTVNGEKMSKSLKNFVLLHDLLEKGISGIVIRYLLLSNHYRKPLDFNDKALKDAKKSIDKFYMAIIDYKQDCKKESIDLLNYSNFNDNKFFKKIISALSDDLNTPKAFAILHELVKLIKYCHKDSDNNKKLLLISNLSQSLDFFGLYDIDYLEQFYDNNMVFIDEAYILEQIELRKKAKLQKNWQLADEIRNKLLSENNIILEDKTDGKTIWKKN